MSEKFAVVIPAYNESRTIRDVVSRALAMCPLVIIVDDGSTDGTVDKLAGLNAVIIRNEKNMGKSASLLRGISHAAGLGAEAVITLDGDGQHKPEDMPKFIEKYSAGSKTIVIGSRLHQRDEFPKARYYANRFANFWVAWAAGTPLNDSQSGFRLYPVRLFKDVHSIAIRSSGFVFESEILIEAGRLGYKIVSAPIDAIYGGNMRPSHFRPVKDIAAITVMVAKKLLERGLFLPGLVRSLKKEPVGK